MYTHTHTHTMKYYSARKKNEIMPFATTWMDLENITLSKVSQKEKDKYHMIRYDITYKTNITYMWNLLEIVKRYK